MIKFLEKKPMEKSQKKNRQNSQNYFNKMTQENLI